MTTVWSGGLQRLLHLRHLHFKVCYESVSSDSATAVSYHMASMSTQQRQGTL